MARTKKQRKPQPQPGSPPFNINTASREQLMTLPGVGKDIAHRIIAARARKSRNRLFRDWADLEARVKGIGVEKLAGIRDSGLALIEWLFDPVRDLPGALTAICLAFVDVRTLLGTAQHVSHAWHAAIDGGLPAMWDDVCLDSFELTDTQLAELPEKSHNRITSLRLFDAFRITQQGLDAIRSLSKLRVLQIKLHSQHVQSFNQVLSSFPHLEELLFKSYTRVDITLPPLHHLKTVLCHISGAVKGLRNLPALTKLKLWGCVESDEWPASLRQVSIYIHDPHDFRVVDRIAALQQPVKISTDWSFAVDNQNTFFTPPYDQLSFLPSFSSLQRLTTGFCQDSIPPRVLFDYLGAMTSLRKLTLSGKRATKDEHLQVLPQLTNLRYLTLAGMRSITHQSLFHLSSLPQLTKLCIDGCYGINNYSPVGSCAQLRDLTIRHEDRRGYRLSHADVQAITQLQHLEKLELIIPFEYQESFGYLCRIPTLRKLVAWPIETGYTEPPISATSFAPLPSLPSLEELCVQPIEAVSELVDCLVQMPKLRSITLLNQLSKQDQDMLRDKLLRLEKLTLLSSEVLPYDKPDFGFWT